MMRQHLAAMSIVVLSCLVLPGAALQAQAPTTQSAPGPVLADLKASIVRAIGAQEATVEIAVTDNILVVSRVNSNMNESTHAGRDNEATAIASIVSKGFSGKTEFKDLITLRIQYSGDAKIIDTIEFRKDPSGAFVFHKT
jgi:hypothetical protein